MRDSVRLAFQGFTTRFEGALDYMYLDVLGLVTTGIGNLIDPIYTATGLPWVHRSDGSPAGRDQIILEWQRVKALQAWKGYGGGYFGDGAQIILTPEGVDALVDGKLMANEAILKRRFVLWEQWPADAQLGTLSVAWAAGPAWVAPNFDMAARALDFAGCRTECWLNDKGNPGLTPRNLANQSLFLNANSVQLAGGDFETLYYPGAPQ